MAELRADVTSMGETVLAQLDDGLTALAEHDRGLAEQVIARDEAVDRRYLELESDCIDLFALQQPVASDLRFIAGSFKIITDLERIGDLATNFGQYTLTGRETEQLGVDVEPIGAKSQALVESALEAYERGDAAATPAIAERDDEIDALCQTASERVVRELIEGKGTDESLWTVEQVLDDVSRVLLSLRDLERVADHGVNIAARTLYMVEGDPELIY
jgi:phosphate transport system protein